MKGVPRRVSRRTLLRGLVGIAGVGISSASLSGCASADKANKVSASGAARSMYRSVANFRPPAITLEVRAPGVAPGVVLTDCHDGTGQQGLMIIGPEGDLVWYKPLSDHGSPSLRGFNLRVQQFRGHPVLTWYEGPVVAGHGDGHYIIADTSYRQIATVAATNGMMGDLHDFFLTDRGTAIFTVYGTGTADLSGLGGAREGAYYYGEVQEVDVASGKLLFSWRSDHHVEFNESYSTLPTNTAAVWDYFHINSIGIDPSDDNLVVSSRNCWTIYKLNRKTGTVMWRLGGKRNDFSMGPDTHFAYQHHVTPYSGGIYTIFDNESSPLVRPPSRALVLQVDEVQRHATLAHQFHHSPPVTSGSSGTVQILPDGHTFVGWGTSTYFTEYAPSGRVLFDGHLTGAGLVSYRAFKQPWSAQPSEPPAVAVERSRHTTIVYVTWNGATEVTHWRVLAAESAGGLQVVATTPKSGFETRIVLATRPSHVAVEALDGTGRVLGRSSVQHL